MQDIPSFFASNPCRAMTEALHIVCPHCHTTNRVQSADLGSAPDCGPVSYTHLTLPTTPYV